MRRKLRLSIPQILAIVLITALSSAGAVLAGTLDSPAAPGSTSSYTLEDIWNRLNAGTAGSASTFTEPSVGPGTSTMHTLNEIMAAAPAVDDTNGATATEVAKGQTFWGLTSGEWGLQTGSYERFTDHGDGTVTDNLTGFMWTKSANHGTYDWFDGKTYIGNLTTGGHTNWQMPEVWELYTLVDESESNPSLPDGHPFTGVQNAIYWSDTKYEDYLIFAYFVRFSDDYVSYANKGISYNVWAMRRP